MGHGPHSPWAHCAASSKSGAKGDHLVESLPHSTGAWHVKGCSLAYSHREYPGTHTLSSGRVELLYTLRCMRSTRLTEWTGKIHHRLVNEGRLGPSVRPDQTTPEPNGISNASHGDVHSHRPRASWSLLPDYRVSGCGYYGCAGCAQLCNGMGNDRALLGKHKDAASYQCPRRLGFMPASSSTSTGRRRSCGTGPAPGSCSSSWPAVFYSALAIQLLSYE